MAHTYVQMPIHKVEDQRAMIRQTIDVLKKFTGRMPTGWLGPGRGQTGATLDYVAEAGFKRFGDWVMDDQPFFVKTKRAMGAQSAGLGRASKTLDSRAVSSRTSGMTIPTGGFHRPTRNPRSGGMTNLSQTNIASASMAQGAVGALPRTLLMQVRLRYNAEVLR